MPKRTMSAHLTQEDAEETNKGRRLPGADKTAGRGAGRGGVKAWRQSRHFNRDQDNVAGYRGSPRTLRGHDQFRPLDQRGQGGGALPGTG